MWNKKLSVTLKIPCHAFMKKEEFKQLSNVGCFSSIYKPLIAINFCDSNESTVWKS